MEKCIEFLKKNSKLIYGNFYEFGSPPIVSNALEKYGASCTICNSHGSQTIPEEFGSRLIELKKPTGCVTDEEMLKFMKDALEQVIEDACKYNDESSQGDKHLDPITFVWLSYYELDFTNNDELHGWIGYALANEHNDENPVMALLHVTIPNGMNERETYEYIALNSIVYITSLCSSDVKTTNGLPIDGYFTNGNINECDLEAIFNNRGVGLTDECMFCIDKNGEWNRIEDTIKYIPEHYVLFSDFNPISEKHFEMINEILKKKPHDSFLMMIPLEQAPKIMYNCYEIKERIQMINSFGLDVVVVKSCDIRSAIINFRTRLQDVKFNFMIDWNTYKVMDNEFFESQDGIFDMISYTVYDDKNEYTLALARDKCNFIVDFECYSYEQYLEDKTGIKKPNRKLFGIAGFNNDGKFNLSESKFKSITDDSLSDKKKIPDAVAVNSTGNKNNKEDIFKEVKILCNMLKKEWFDDYTKYTHLVSVLHSIDKSDDMFQIVYKVSINKAVKPEACLSVWKNMEEIDLNCFDIDELRNIAQESNPTEYWKHKNGNTYQHWNYRTNSGYETNSGTYRYDAGTHSNYGSTCNYGSDGYPRYSPPDYSTNIDDHVKVQKKYDKNIESSSEIRRWNFNNTGFEADDEGNDQGFDLTDYAYGDGDFNDSVFQK